MLDFINLSPKRRLFLTALNFAKEVSDQLEEWVFEEEEDEKLVPEAKSVLIGGVVCFKGFSHLEVGVEGLEVLHEELTDNE